MHREVEDFVKNLFTFLGAFAKLRKAIISFVMSVCLSARPHGTTRLPMEGFSKKFIFEVLRNFVEEIQVPLKPEKNNRYCTCRLV